MPNFNTMTQPQREMPCMEALKRAEDTLKAMPYDWQQKSFQWMLQEVLTSASQKYGFQDVPSFTRSIPKLNEFDAASYLLTPASEGPFEVQVAGYYAATFDTTTEADAYAKCNIDPTEYAEVLNAKQEVLANYFDASEPYVVFIVDAFNDETDSGTDWFVHMRLALSSLELDVQTFGTEEQVYAYAAEAVSANNVFTGDQAFVVAKLNLDTEGRLLTYPDAKVVMVFSCGEVAEYRETVPEYFKSEHPECVY